MNLQNRLTFYSQLEKSRGNPLIIYVTSSREGARGSMAQDSIEKIVEQVELLPTDTPEVDFLIESTGGDGLTSWRIISILRSKAKKVNVLIPDIAFSAATILALGADEIIMGRYGCLGPTDPQIKVIKGNNQESFAYEDILSFINFAKSEVGLTEQEHIIETLKLLSKQVQPSAIGLARRASSLSVDMGEKLLQTHMNKSTEERNTAREIATRLNKSFFSHGHALYRNEAKDIGLNVKNADNTVEDLMRKIHTSFKDELKSEDKFDPLAEFLSERGTDAYLNAFPPVNIPAQTNPQVLQQIIGNYIQNQLN